MFMAGVTPGDAVSHLSEWALFFGVPNVPSWLARKSADTWGFWIGLLGLIAWGTIKWRHSLAGLFTSTASSPKVNRESRSKKKKLAEPPGVTSNSITIDRVVLLLVVVAVGFLIGYEVYKSYRQVGGFIQIEKMGVPGPPLLTVGVRNYINVGYTNRGMAPVSGAMQITQVVFAGSRTIPDLDTTTFNKAKEMARFQKAEMADRAGVLLGPGQKIWTTVEIDFTDDDVKKLMAGTATLYLLGYAFWNEYPGQMAVCFKLQPPKYHPLKESDIVWHHCDLRKGDH